ncbi:type IV secretory system conjugative DNA transfer family protein [Vibrio splendidus]|nr:type IV secretory system conjugative DNA transfer family protein [Vibrio splendidus]MCC4883198.1 type IV secretory system conjugative DNA transfer family protein [Vibrio splendidus]
MSVQFHGVTSSDDLSPGLIKKDTRTTMESFRDLTYNSSGEVMMGMGLIILLAPFFGSVILSEMIFILAMIYYPYQKKKVKSYIFHEPISECDDRKKPTKASGKGLLLVGNSKIDKTGLWFSDDDLRTHMLVFGTTGSGKTRFLLGVLYQSMMFGSGCLYVDGKGDNTVWWLVFSFCRKINKVDDLLVINYLTGEEDLTQGGKPSLKRKSNTSNPFAYGSSEQLRSLIVGLMRDGGGDDMWKGRASSMLGTLLKALTEMRNAGEMNLDIETIRDHMPLDRIVQLSMREDFKPSVLNSIQKYLADLPGYKEQDAMMGSIEQKAYEQVRPVRH